MRSPTESTSRRGTHYLSKREGTDKVDGMASKRFSDQLRDAVDGSGMSRYAICKAIGLPESSMSRFMAGKSGLSMGVVDRLADRLGLTVTAKPKPKAIKPSRGGTDGVVS